MKLKIRLYLALFAACLTMASLTGKNELVAMAVVPAFAIQRRPGGNNPPPRKIVARPTQLQKALSVAQKFGAPADGAQFTERVIYDTLPLDGRTEFNFFEGCGTRTFPRTNLNENKLQKQENMIIKFISLEAVTYSAANSLPVVAINPLSTAFGQLYRSDLSIQIAQSVVLKQLPMDDMKPEFSPFAKHTTHNVIKLGVDLTIPELLEFVARLRTGAYTASTTIELMIKLHGQATIMSPRASF